MDEKYDRLVAPGILYSTTPYSRRLGKLTKYLKNNFIHSSVYVLHVPAQSKKPDSTRAPKLDRNWLQAATLRPRAKGEKNECGQTKSLSITQRFSVR
jgi:hypothetical protein